MKSFTHIFAALLLLVLMVSGCKQKSGMAPPDPPAFNPMITAFTSGIISSESAVQVRFAQPFPDSVEINSLVEKGVMSLQPATDGNAYYIDQQTIEFRPGERFKQGTAYDVQLKINKLFPGSQTEKSFDFRFYTTDQHLSIELAGFRPYNDYQPLLNSLTGTLRTSDFADPEAIRSVIKVVQEKKELPVRWTHQSDRKVHEFTIDSILRGEKELKVEVKYNGAAISSEQKGVQEFIVPPLGDFKVIGHTLVQFPEQHVVLSFSDPIRKNQSLEGLIRLSNDTDMRFIVDGNSVDVIRSARSTGSILKPFLFAGMLDNGDILQTTLIPDVPIRYNGYAPTLSWVDKREGWYLRWPTVILLPGFSGTWMNRLSEQLLDGISWRQICRRESIP